MSIMSWLMNNEHWEAERRMREQVKREREERERYLSTIRQHEEEERIEAEKSTQRVELQKSYRAVRDKVDRCSTNLQQIEINLRDLARRRLQIDEESNSFVSQQAKLKSQMADLESELNHRKSEFDALCKLHNEEKIASDKLKQEARRAQQRELWKQRQEQVEANAEAETKVIAEWETEHKDAQ